MNPAEIAWTLPVALSALLYTTMIATFALARARAVRASSRVPRTSPRVSILKPLAGRDDDLASNLDTFAALAWPDFELLIGVASPDDPAFEEARAFVRRHPRVCARVLVTDPEAALNPKVAQLLTLEREATGDIVVISDSNVRVTSRWLDALVSELEQPDVGLVSTLVAGTGERSLGAALENLQLATAIAPGIAAAFALSGRAITVGKSMAMRRSALRDAGGFEAVRDVLAEDHVLGRLVSAAGWRVRVSASTVENRNVRCGAVRMLERHARWMLMRRVLAPAGFALEPVLSPIAVATVVALVAQTKASGVALAAAGVLQMTGALVATRLLRGRGFDYRLLPLEVVRAYAALGCWVVAWGRRRVSWRGHELEVGAGTLLRRAAPARVARRPRRAPSAA